MAMDHGSSPPITSERIFEERAENLSKTELQTWSAETNRDRQIIKKLKGHGAKLLSGPRGSGKSTLLLKSYYELLDEGETLPIYVNYAKSLALEPLFYSRANALQIFRQWVLLKILRGLQESLKHIGAEDYRGYEQYLSLAANFIGALERGDIPHVAASSITPSELILLLEEWGAALGYKRIVLLFDDAAHAFSPPQQREFFEIFRTLKSPLVSPKAAVYPGITSYSPNFHIGHDAELVEAWYHPDEEGYLELMRNVVQRRLPTSLSSRLVGKEELVDYVAFAAFGLPRGFLTMISEILGVEEEETNRPTRTLAKGTISAHAAMVRGVFQALSIKLPRYSHFIEVGRELENAMVRALKKFNSSRSVGHKAVAVAIGEPLQPELAKVVSLLEYAGVLRNFGSSSRGEGRFYRKYAIHYAVLIEENALSLGKTFSLSDLIASFLKRDRLAIVHSRGDSLLGQNFSERCTIDLAPCQSCGAARVSEDARFCVQCGSKLSDASIYEEVLKTAVDQLPLTANKIEGLKKHTQIKTVQDILLDEEMKEIRKVPYVGPVWASRIRNAAEEFVSV